MTAIQMGITIAVCTAATMLTRFLPFVVFSSKDQQPPEVVRYLGRVLPAAIFGMLIVYCLKSVTPFAGSRGAPEAIALLVTVARHPVLCAAGAAGILIGKSSPVMALCHGRRSFLLSDRRYRSSPDGRSAAAAGRSCRSSGPAATCSW